MNNLLDLTNAADKAAISETNFQRIDGSLAFMLTPSLVAGVPTAVAGPPTAGAFIQGQIWVDSLLAQWVCTVAGTPGTWQQQTAAIVAAAPSGATVPNNYLITLPGSAWQSQYWSGSAWTNIA